MGTTTAISARSLQYYVIANRWALELDFFDTETAFLYYLIDEYFKRLCAPSHMKKFSQVITKLSELEINKDQADQLLAVQLKHLELMADDIIHENIDSLAEKQIRLEYMITDLMNEYREIKGELFAIVDILRKIKAG